MVKTVSQQKSKNVISSSLGQIFELIFDFLIPTPFKRFHRIVYLLLRIMQIFIIFTLVISIFALVIASLQEGMEMFFKLGFWKWIISLFIGFLFFELIIRINYPKKDFKSQAQARKLWFMVVGIMILPLILAFLVCQLLLIYFLFKVIIYLVGHFYNRLAENPGFLSQGSL